MKRSRLDRSSVIEGARTSIIILCTFSSALADESPAKDAKIKPAEKMHAKTQDADTPAAFKLDLGAFFESAELGNIGVVNHNIKWAQLALGGFQC